MCNSRYSDFYDIILTLFPADITFKHNVMSCPKKNFNSWFPYLRDSHHFIKFGYLPINLGVSYTYFFNLHEEDKTK